MRLCSEVGAREEEVLVLQEVVRQSTGQEQAEEAEWRTSHNYN